MRGEMKKALVLIALVLLITGAAGCGKPVPGETTQKSDFNFILKYGITARNEINTFDGKFTKDMIADPPITIDLVLSGTEMDNIYQKMLDIDFFNYPEEFKVIVPEGELISTVTPYSGYYFTVEYSSKVKELKWEDEITNPDIKADKLRELIKLIRDIIESKPEYKALPEPSGGYL